MNGERLCGLLYHMCSCKVTKAQTLWEVETAADTIQTVVLYLNGLHQATSRLQGILRYPSNHQPSDKAGNIHTLPQHGECSPGSAVVPHPCILQTWRPCACHIAPRLQVHITLLPFPGQTPPDEAAFHIGLPPGRGQTDRACQSGPGTVFMDLYKLPAGRLGNVTPDGRICLQQHHERDDGSVPIFREQRVSPGVHSGPAGQYIVSRSANVCGRLGTHPGGVEGEHRTGSGEVSEECGQA